MTAFSVSYRRLFWFMIPIPIYNSAENIIAITNMHGHRWPCLSEHGCLERFAGAISFRALNFRNWYDFAAKMAG